MPSTTAAPGPCIDAPRAATPLVEANSRFVSNSQRIAPFTAEYARSAPSFDPENTTPGMTVTAADCAAVQPRPAAQTGFAGAAYQARSPVARLTACRPPGCGEVMSDTPKYARSPSAEAPHSIPPSTPPCPAR